MKRQTPENSNDQGSSKIRRVVRIKTPKVEAATTSILEIRGQAEAFQTRLMAMPREDAHAEQRDDILEELTLLAESIPDVMESHRTRDLTVLESEAIVYMFNKCHADVWEIAKQCENYVMGLAGELDPETGLA
jgi:hypothetical protein